MFDRQIKMKIIVPKIGDYRSPTEIYMFNLIVIILQFRRAALSALIIFFNIKVRILSPTSKILWKIITWGPDAHCKIESSDLTGLSFFLRERYESGIRNCVFIG